MNARIQDRVAPQFRLLINGQLVAGASTFDVINPATEQVLATCPRADAAQLDAAVAAAKAAFPALVGPIACRPPATAQCTGRRAGGPQRRVREAPDQ